MKVGAFIRGAPAEEQKRQRRAIKEMLKGQGADVTWFKEADGRQRRDEQDRVELQSCAKWCRANSATLAIASCSKLFPRKWQALTWLKNQVEMYDTKVQVADDPTINGGSLHVLSAAADVQRARIAAKSMAAINSIKAKLKTDGSYTSKRGNEITRLGIHSKLTAAGAKGNEAQSELARERDDEVWPIIQSCRERGMGYAGTARQLNAMGVATPSSRARHDRETTGEWYASTVRNIVLRREK